MSSSRPGGRQRKLLLAVVAVSSGMTASCHASGIGLFDSGWNRMFDAARQDAGHAASDATADAPSDASNATDVDAH